MNRFATRLPPSKSQLIRALVAAALADGPSTLALHGTDLVDEEGTLVLGPRLPRDVSAALGAALDLGAALRQGADGLLEVTPMVSPRRERWRCGESALLLRLLLPIAAALGGVDGLDGAGTLLGRPIFPLLPPLEALGARFERHPLVGRALPIGVRGRLHGGELTLDGSLTSQLASGLLMALPLCAEPSRLSITNATSRPYLDLTVQVLRAFGVEVRQGARGELFEIPGGQRYRGARIDIEADWSAAAFPLVIGAIRREAPKVALQGLCPDSAQADRAICDLLGDIGADLGWQDGALVCRHRSLSAFDVSLRDTPDLLPPLATLALFCPGSSRLRDIGRTRFKESDRPRALCEAFAKLGARLWREGEDLCIRGGPLRAGRVSASADHRVAMALGVAGLCAGVRVEITDGASAVQKSFPGFFEAMSAL